MSEPQSALADKVKKPRFSLMLGESVFNLRALPSEHYDAVITDPPYASGGLHIGNRQATTSSKYGIDGQPAQFFGFLYEAPPDSQGRHLIRKSGIP